MGKEGLNRRDFIKLASLGLAGGYLGVNPGLSEAMMRPGENAVFDPPPGDLLEDPVEMPTLSTGDGIVEVNLDTKVSPININGTMVNLMTYNGYFPGPTIRVSQA